MSQFGRHKVLFLVAMLILYVRPAGSQEVACTTRDIPVSLRDAENLPLRDVSINDLEAKMHGKPVKILSLKPDPRPHRLVILLDTSGSIGSTISNESPLWSLELLLARHFYELNSQRAQIALLFFNERVTDVIGFDKGNSAVGNKLDELAHDRSFSKTNIKGRTALRDAILQGILLFDHPTSADAVYVLTDGGENSSSESSRELMKRLAVTSVRVFAILLYKSSGYRTPEELSGPGDLDYITQKSGGEILSAAERRGDRIVLTADTEAKRKATETLERLYQAILQDSLLGVQLPYPNAKNEHWELKFSNEGRSRWKNAHITYPDTMLSCDSEVSGSGRN